VIYEPLEFMEKLAALARISHQLSTAEAHPGMSISRANSTPVQFSHIVTWLS
jgi:hypothetical protein